MRTIFAVGAFLFCWSFNPFSDAVLYTHMTGAMGLSDQFFGHMRVAEAAAGMAGSLLYAAYCRRVPMTALLHVSIVAGVVSTAAYWFLAGERSAAIIAAASNFAIATATVIQLDLAAQVCPPQAAGTLFALLMSLSNLGAGQCALARRLVL